MKNKHPFPRPSYTRKEHWATAKNSLVGRLMGVYAIGPNADQMTTQDNPEFGWRVMPVTEPIRFEAAERIEELEAKIRELEDTISDLYRQLSYSDVSSM